MKHNKIICLSLLVVVLASTFYIPLLAVQSVIPNVVVLHDATDGTATKTVNIVTEMLARDVSVKYVATESLDQLENFLLTTSSRLVVYIFHGTMTGMQVGDGMVSWTRLSELVDSSSIAIHQFQACYSYFVESQVKKVSGHEGRVDYLIAGLSAARSIAEFSGSTLAIERIENTAENMKQELIMRAVFPVDPLWGGNTHDRLSKAAISILDSSSNNWLTSNSYYSTMVDASLADKDDGVIDLLNKDTLEQIWTLWSDTVVRGKWLKHIGGTIKIKYGIPTFLGTWYITDYWRGKAAQSAEDAFNSAVYYWSLRKYSTGAKYLSYAAHYLQDMAQPYHTKDLTIRLLGGVTILDAMFLIDYFNDHTALEDYVGNYQRWNSKKSDWTANARVKTITDVSDSVNELISISRAQSLSCMDSSGDLVDSNADLQIALKNLLSEAVSYGAGLYKLFTKQASGYCDITSPSNGKYYINSASITVRGVTSLGSYWVKVYLNGILMNRASLSTTGSEKTFSYYLGTFYARPYEFKTYKITCIDSTGHTDSVTFYLFTRYF
ncbi:MAG: hypothetical protein ACXAEU_02410 [Candidatus Hodarchaeales archaeon]